MRTIFIVNSLSLLTAAVLLTACGGGDSTAPAQVLLTCNSPEVPNAAGTACVAPQPIKCKAPTFPDAKNESCVIGYNPKLPEPVVTPSAEQAVLYLIKKAVMTATGYIPGTMKVVMLIWTVHWPNPGITAWNRMGLIQCTGPIGC